MVFSLTEKIKKNSEVAIRKMKRAEYFSGWNRRGYNLRKFKILAQDPTRKLRVEFKLASLLMHCMRNIGLAVPRLLRLPITQHLSTKRRLGKESKNKDGKEVEGDCSRLKLSHLPFFALDLDPEADMVSRHHHEGGDEGLFPEIEKKIDVSFLLQI